MAPISQSHNIEQRVSDLEREFGLLRSQFEGLSAQIGSNSHTLTGDSRAQPCGITEAIQEFLSENRSGVTRDQICDAVEPRVFSKSEKPRHTIHVTLNRLERDRRIGRDGDLYFLAQAEPTGQTPATNTRGASELFGGL